MNVQDTALLKAVEDNNIEEASALINSGANANARKIDVEKLQSAHDVLTSSVTADHLNAISVISVPYDVTVAIIYAVCLITCDDVVKPDMPFLDVW